MKDISITIPIIYSDGTTNEIILTGQMLKPPATTKFVKEIGTPIVKVIKGGTTSGKKQTNTGTKKGT